MAARDWHTDFELISLTGANAPLADHYIEKIMQASQQKNFALQDFLDIFQQRCSNLYSKAKQRSQLYIQHENNSKLNIILESLSGNKKHHFYTGLFSQKPSNTISLQNILSDYFDLPIKIKEFIGEWIYLDCKDYTRLKLEPSPENYNQLGINTFIGKRFWNIQNKFRIVIGPLKYNKFRQLLPDGNMLQAIKELTQCYVNNYYGFEIELILMPKEVPYCYLRKYNSMRLGWNTWLKSKPCSEVTRTLLAKVIFRQITLF